MKVLVGIVVFGILFLIRMLFAFWREGKVRKQQVSVELIDFKPEEGGRGSLEDHSSRSVSRLG